MTSYMGVHKGLSNSTEDLISAFDADEGLEGFGNLVKSVRNIWVDAPLIIDKVNFEGMLIDLKAIREAFSVVSRSI